MTIIITGQVEFSPDGDSFLSCADYSAICLWDRSGQKIKTIDINCSWGAIATFLSDGKRIAVWGYDPKLHLLDVESGREFKTVSLASGYSLLQIIHNGHSLYESDDSERCRILDIDSGQITREFPRRNNRVGATLSPDGRMAASGIYCTTISLWDFVSEEDIRHLEGHVGSINQINFSPDGKTIVSCSQDTTIRLWDVQSGLEIRKFEHSMPVNNAVFSPDGLTIASCSDDRTIRLWDVATGMEKQKFDGHHQFVTWISFSPDGTTLVSCDNHGKIALWG
ncbi:WD repeat-containing protein [Reticulomyxa filosa]|uniref:WD repeat-containing protein n=1 Tax=Reticulomyxa filosa TaxID=46433 RepID=X6MPX1_RETFI|nr:WD repeat-containing protein [Reticulomyxa filosa]|eukprot:ETO15150.1 WD repeat-containing protein [Reticulomyxa filosa]